MYTCLTKMQEFDLRYNCITTNSHSSQVFFKTIWLHQLAWNLDIGHL